MYQMEQYIIIGLILLIVLLLFFNVQKEHFGFRATGCKRKDACMRHYLGLYNRCLKNSDRDECWARTKPRLFSCLYGAF